MDTFSHRISYLLSAGLPLDDVYAKYIEDRYKRTMLGLPRAKREEVCAHPDQYYPGFKKKLTRMKPNRRTGFDQMGSAREFTTKLLVAVDVSGSISDTNLANFYSVINKMFKYGIDEIDCVQFDCQLGPIKNIRKACRQIEITGRGGTSFQPIFDYLLEHNTYDGLVILTDGAAPHPKIDDRIRTEILWVCESERSYEECHSWMELCGRCCWMMLSNIKP